MNTRLLMCMGAALLASTAVAANAQSMPGTAAKAAARRAVKAEDAQLKAQMDQVVQQAQPDSAAAPAAAGVNSGRTVAASNGAAVVLDTAPVLMREIYSYSKDSRRDPFASLMSSPDLRPTISDLNLLGILFDPAGRSVAIMRDVTTNAQYRVNNGMTLGRMRVSGIHHNSVVFTIEEFGFSRQDSVMLRDSTQVRPK